MKKQIHLHPDDLKKSDQMGLTYNLGQAHKRMLLKQSSIMKKYGLTARQALIIAYLSTHKKEVVTQKVLEDHLHLTNPTITVMVRTMIKKRPHTQRAGRRRCKEIPPLPHRPGKRSGRSQPQRSHRPGQTFLPGRIGYGYENFPGCSWKNFEKPGYRLTYVHQEPIHFGSFLLHSCRVQTGYSKTSSSTPAKDLLL